MNLRLKKTVCFLFWGVIFSAHAGEMAAVSYDRENGFYALALGTYNAFNFNHAETASFFSPVAIEAPAASIGDKWGYSLGAGYRFNSFFRTDFRVQGLSDISFSVIDDGNETANGRISTYTYMLNGYISYPLSIDKRIEPYLAGGLGAAHSATNTIYWPLAAQHESGLATTRFSWQIGAGCLYRITEHLDFDINYSYLAIGRTSNSGQYDMVATNGVPAIGAPTKLLQVYSNQFSLGLNYRI